MSIGLLLAEVTLNRLLLALDRVSKPARRFL